MYTVQIIDQWDMSFDIVNFIAKIQSTKRIQKSPTRNSCPAYWIDSMEKAFCDSINSHKILTIREVFRNMGNSIVHCPGLQLAKDTWHKRKRASNWDWIMNLKLIDCSYLNYNIYDYIRIKLIFSWAPKKAFRSSLVFFPINWRDFQKIYFDRDQRFYGSFKHQLKSIK